MLAGTSQMLTLIIMVSIVCCSNGSATAHSLTPRLLMSDQPFSPFSPSPPPKPMFDPAQETGKKPRKKRTAKAVKAPKRVKASAAPAEVVPQAVPTRKRARKPRPTMIPIGILPALAGLQDAEASMLMSIIGNLQEAPKKSRAKIVAALGKVFA